MDAVEIVVFLAVAVALLGIVTLFLADWQISDQSEGLLNILFGDDDLRAGDYQSVDYDELIMLLRSEMQHCTPTSGQNVTNSSDTRETNATLVYIKEEGVLNASSVFERIRSVAWCDTLQNKDHGCGTRTNLHINQTMIPAVLQISCFNGSLYLG
ncbi:MAG: hypothetical protein HC945_00355 [Nitrosarchaeum sp.]|nr:hypothetical protein [Nitrosarchaeum sp.]